MRAVRRVGCFALVMFSVLRAFPHDSKQNQAATPSASFSTSSEHPMRGVPRFPDVSATQITFLFGGELWVVPRQGGMAKSRTKEAGPKSSPKFSPDGATIAFTGDYDGVYTIPAAGGPVTRITHHPRATDLCDWTPDGNLLFMTNAFFPPGDFGEQASLRQLFIVSAKGGLPRKLPVTHGANAAISDDGEWLAYTPYAEGRTEHKMHYRGGMAPNIWLFGLKNHVSKKITDWMGINTAPMWQGRTIYYLSDEGSERRLNIWSYQLDTKNRRQITHFGAFDVKWPSVGPGSSGKGEIVFVNGTKLYLLDLASHTSHEVNVFFPEDRLDLNTRSVEASDSITNWNASPDGRRAVVEARGSLWIAAEQEPPRELPHTAGTAQRYPSWSPDGRWIAYCSDQTGEYELYIAASDGTGMPRQISHWGAGFCFWPSWAPNSQQITFFDNNGTIYLYSFEKDATRKIHEDPIVREPKISWSPDSSWLAFTGSAKSNQVIWLYDVEGHQLRQVTEGGYNDKWPTFDARGEYLFFVSGRNFQDSLTEDSVDYGSFGYPSTDLIMALPLRSDLRGPGKLPITAGKSSIEGSQKRVLIDLDDMERRCVVLASDVGAYSNLTSTREGKLLYGFIARDHLYPSSPGSGPSIKLLDFVEQSSNGNKEPKTLLEGFNDFRISADGSSLLVRKNKTISRMEPIVGQKLKEAMNLGDMHEQIQPPAEWRQIFTDAWRLYRDFFYDPAMRGVDWVAARKKYESLLDDCADREDVDYVIGEMLGELGSSHVYLEPAPGKQLPPENVGMLDVDFEIDHGAYRIAKIYDGAESDVEARSPLRQPGVHVDEGEYILAVDDTRLDVARDPWAAFIGLAGKDVKLTISRKPFIDETARNVTVQPEYFELGRIRGWVESNRAYVDRKTNSRVGYVYLKMTSEYGYREFTRQFATQLNKEALIVDIRWNQGGHIPFRLIDIFRRQLAYYGNDRRRNVDQRNPGYQQVGPKCFLINGVTQSGGDQLANLVEKNRVGTLVGSRTMGAMAGAGGLYIPFIDGGNSLVPTVGFLDFKGRWTVEGYGVEPNVSVEEDPAFMWRAAGSQLDAAIRILLDELRQRPPVPAEMPSRRR